MVNERDEDIRQLGIYIDQLQGQIDFLKMKLISDRADALGLSAPDTTKELDDFVDSLSHAPIRVSALRETTDWFHDFINRIRNR